jgi:methylmalonyl-CoA mutase cobalamin-binding domain/chain
MYRHRPWTMRQYTGFGNARDTNERFKFLIANGQTGLNVAFDLPTQCGLDSDDPLAEGEVGRVGMAVDTLQDFEVAFDGIDLDRVTVSLTINGAAPHLIAMYLAMAEKRGFDVKSLRGTAQNDILKEFIGRGTWIFPVEPSVRLVGRHDRVLRRSTRPKYSPVSVCGYHIRESGANAGAGDGLRVLRSPRLCRRGAGARRGRSTSSPAACPSTSTSSATSSSRSRSSAPAAACGRGSSPRTTAPGSLNRPGCA